MNNLIERREKNEKKLKNKISGGPNANQQAKDNSNDNYRDFEDEVKRMQQNTNNTGSTKKQAAVPVREMEEAKDTQKKASPSMSKKMFKEEANVYDLDGEEDQILDKKKKLELRKKEQEEIENLYRDGNSDADSDSRMDNLNKIAGKHKKDAIFEKFRAPQLSNQENDEDENEFSGDEMESQSESRSVQEGDEQEEGSDQW